MSRNAVPKIMLVLFLAGTLHIALNVKIVISWSNGGFSSNPDEPNYGTHDWIAEHALDWLPEEEKIYILNNLATYLYGTELPDNSGAPDGIGDTSLHHIYFWQNGSLQDDASAVRAQEEYNNALSYFKSDHVTLAVKTLGIMSHYIVDVAVFGHVMGAGTDWGPETHHSDYEAYVNDRTNSYVDDYNIYLGFDGSLDLTNAYDAAFAIAYETTFDWLGDFTCLWMDQHYNWSNPVFQERTVSLLNLAVNYLADVLHRFYIETQTPLVRNQNTGINYTRIQDAIDDELTLDDHIIEVWPGIYYENVIVDKSLWIYGHGAGLSGIDANYSETVVDIVANDVTISHFTIQHSGPWSSRGINVFDSTSNNISFNLISNNALGLYLNRTSNSIISDNRITGNVDGVGLRASPNNTIADNVIAHNYDSGLWLWQYPCYDNRIVGNDISENLNFGIEFAVGGSGNSIYHNNFISNTNQVYLGNTTNIWDHGYPVGGNFWSDYSGIDNNSGPYQNETGYDGIGDTPYSKDGIALDNYPLMGLSGPLTITGENISVFPSEDVGLFYRAILEEGFSIVNRIDTGEPPPSGRVWFGQFYEIETTASYSGKIRIRIVYPEGLTPEEEESLQLAHLILQGDITGGTPDPYDFIPDGKVDIKDIAMIAKYFGQNVPPVSPRCDINGPVLGVPDGKIDIRDIALAAMNFGKTQPEWINITTFLDTENNVIIGETSRLSIFGVHYQ